MRSGGIKNGRLAAILGSLGSRVAGQEPQDVLVRNTSSNAVPTSIVGTPTVGIDPNASTVRLAEPRPLPTPVQKRATFGVAVGEGNKAIAVFSVPAGKRLVGRFVSVRGPAIEGTRVTGQLAFRFGDGVSEVVTPFHRSPNNTVGTEFVEASIPILAYAAPGTDVTYGVVRSDATTNAQYNVTLVGELMDVSG